MASIETLQDTLRDLKKREGELYAFLEPLRKMFMETKSKTEKKSLKNKMNPGLEELKALVQKIGEVKASINAVAGPLGDIPVHHSEEASGELPLDPLEKTSREPLLSPLRIHKSSGELSPNPLEKTSREPLLSPLRKPSGELPLDLPDNAAGEPPVDPLDEASGKPPLDTPDNTAGEPPVDPPGQSWGEHPISPPEKTPGATSVVPKKPKRSAPTNFAVLRFEADGTVYCFGHLDKTTKPGSIQVLPWVKVTSAVDPNFTIQVKFPRDKTPIPGFHFHDPAFHSVWYKFQSNTYEVEEHLVTDKKEFGQFLKDAPRHVHGKANEAMKQQKLYRITFSYDDHKIWQGHFPNIYASSVPEIQKNFEAMSLVPTCKTLSIFMWKYEDLPANLQYLYAEQKDYVPPLDLYLHKYKEGKDA